MSSESKYPPLLSFRIGQVDPGQAPRDEGEARLLPLRPLLRLAVREPGFQDFLNPAKATCFVKGLSPAAVLRAADVVQSLLTTTSALRPTARLVVPTVLTLSVREADRLDVEQRAQCVPLRGAREVALPGYPARNAKPRVVVAWPSLADKRAPELIVECSDNRLHFLASNGSGAPARSLGSAGNFRQQLLDALFAKAPAVPFNPLRRLPDRPAEVPDALQMRIGQFAQHTLRLHALVTAALPGVDSRPLAFENMRFYCEPRDRRQPKITRVVVKAFLHASSCSCICPAHNRSPPAPGQHSEVMLSFSMCGMKLQTDKFQPQGVCPVHQNATATHSLAPGVCCADCQVNLVCRHRIKGEPVRRLSLDHGPFERAAWLELTTLLALAADFHGGAAALFEQGGKAVRASVRALEARIDKALLELSQRAVEMAGRPSPQALLRADWACVDTLRIGGVAQCHPRQKKRKLVSLDGSDLHEKQKQLHKTHYWLFPRHGCAAPVRAERPGSSAEPERPGSNTGPPSPPAAPSPEPPRRKEGWGYQTITEYIDPEGVAELQRQVGALLDSKALSSRERDRAVFFQRLVQAIDETYGDPVEVQGRLLRPLEVDYREKHGGGRDWATNAKLIDDPFSTEPKAICLQTMYSEMRPFLCGRFARDIDQVSSQPTIVDKVMDLISWADGRAPPERPHLRSWIADRKGFIDAVAECHGIEDRYEDERKTAVKDLMIRLLFGGSYRAWIEEVLRRDSDTEPRFPPVSKLEKELNAIRLAVFQSKEWGPWCAGHSARLRAEGKTEKEVVRSVFALWAQKQESIVLKAMRGHLEEEGWAVVALVFDGLIVFDRPGCTLDLRAMEARILKDTRIAMQISEKPLFLPEGTPYPTLSLKRFG